jgi:hypothetical protein
MRFRVWLTQHLGAPATAEPAARAEDWLRGRADLLIAGMGGQVPVVVQLGVLAHADLGRLADLGRNSRRGSVRRAWGTEMARLAVLAATPERLAALQRNLLMPLEFGGTGRPRRTLHPCGCHQASAKPASLPGRQDRRECPSAAKELTT